MINLVEIKAQNSGQQAALQMLMSIKSYFYSNNEGLGMAISNYSYSLHPVTLTCKASSQS